MDIWPADVARHMGVSRSAYHQWEKNITRPKDIDSYDRLAAFLGVKRKDLGVDVGEMRAVPPKPKTYKQITRKPGEEGKGGEG